MLQMNNIPEQVEVLIEEGVKIVTTGAGTPKHYMERLKQAGYQSVSCDTLSETGTKMEQLGVDGYHHLEGMEAADILVGKRLPWH